MQKCASDENRKKGTFQKTAGIPTVFSVFNYSERKGNIPYTIMDETGVRVYAVGARSIESNFREIKGKRKHEEISVRGWFSG